MAVVSFSRARFTPADIAEFDIVAEPRMVQGLWDRVERLTDQLGDRLLISLPEIDRTVFIFERHRCGTYRIWFQDRADGWHLITERDTASECLWIWNPTPKVENPALSPAVALPRSASLES